MAKYRKLGRTSPQRKALLRNQVTALLYHGKIVTTEARAKEVRKIAEHLIAMAVREKDNFETVTVTAKVPVKDKDGKRVKEVVDGKKVTKFESVEKEIKKDLPSRLHVRRQILRVLYPVVYVPTEAAGRKRNTKEVDLVAKLLTSMGPSMRIAMAVIPESSRKAPVRAMRPWRSFWSSSKGFPSTKRAWEKGMSRFAKNDSNETKGANVSWFPFYDTGTRGRRLRGCGSPAAGRRNQLVFWKCW